MPSNRLCDPSSPAPAARLSAEDGRPSGEVNGGFPNAVHELQLRLSREIEAALETDEAEIACIHLDTAIQCARKIHSMRKRNGMSARLG